MANRSIELGRLVRYDPEEATKRILATIRSTGGNLEAAGRLLNVAPRTVKRWIARLDIRARVVAIQRKHNWFPGRLAKYDALPPRARVRDFVQDF